MKLKNNRIILLLEILTGFSNNNIAEFKREQNMRVSVIELTSFEDMVLFLYSRLTTMNLNSSLLCNEKNCFTIITATEQQIFVITSPPPQNQKCRYAYLDDYGKTICSETPMAGRPTIFILAVRNIRETESLIDALTKTAQIISIT